MLNPHYTLLTPVTPLLHSVSPPLQPVTLHYVTSCYTLLHPDTPLLHPLTSPIYSVTPRYTPAVVLQQNFCLPVLYSSSFPPQSHELRGPPFGLKCQVHLVQFRISISRSFLEQFVLVYIIRVIFLPKWYLLKRNRRKHYHFACTDLPVCAILIDYSCVIARHD